MANKDSSDSADWIVFRLDGKRYGVPMAQVRDLGRLDGTAWMQCRARGRYGDYKLRDLKGTLRLPGEAGGLFIAMETLTGVVTAWAVDGIESARFDLAGSAWSASRQGRGPVLGTARALSSHPSNRQPYGMVLEGDQAPIQPAFPITLLDPYQF